MKKLFLLFSIFCFSFQITSAQLSLEVYDIFQNKCMGCHSNATQTAGLDLEGSGANITLKMNDVYNNLVGQTPNSNPNAITKGYKYIYEGRPDLSYLYRKINGSLESTITLDTGVEGAQMPFNQPELTDVEKELIRQWILIGAPRENNDAEVPTAYVDQIPTLVNNYYNVSGVQSFPNGGPAAPDPSEGFQVKMGPFYLNPAGQSFSEMELFQKYELDLPEDVEVNRIDMKISTSSHHFIIYNFPLPFVANNVKPGFRTYPDHNFISLTAAVQQATDLKLPEGTAFNWADDMILDLNSHYINADASNTYQAEVYFNVYTQPAGTAAQEMKTEILLKENIPIPNNGNLTTFEQAEFNMTGGEFFIWGLMGHTHQWGKDYKVYLRNPNGTKGELIYDASCSLDGAPGCVAPFFDYQHIPIRYFEPLLPMDLNPGFIHTASYENNGPTNVNWGPTSDDEMMVLVMMYTTDTAGLNMTTSIENIDDLHQEIKVYPNPMDNEATVVLPKEMGTTRFVLYNSIGQEVLIKQNIYENNFTFRKGDLPRGIYLFRAEDEDGKFGTGRIMIND